MSKEPEAAAEMLLREVHNIAEKYADNTEELQAQLRVIKATSLIRSVEDASYARVHKTVADAIDEILKNHDFEPENGMLCWFFNDRSGKVAVETLLDSIPEDMVPREDDPQHIEYEKIHKFLNRLSESLEEKTEFKNALSAIRSWARKDIKRQYLLDTFQQALANYSSEYSRRDENRAEPNLVTGKDEDDLAASFNPAIVKKTGVKLRDVGGIRNAKEQFQDIIEMLRDPKRFALTGGELYKGILLQGIPGVGKTHIVKAIAEESGAPMIAVNATDFDAKYYGEGAARMKKLFRLARSEVERQKKEGEQSPSCLIFIDEIDVIAHARSQDDSSGHEMAAMQLATELNGFKPSEGIMVIAATNRPEVLDPAFRTGRIDHRIEINAPETKDRKEIIDIHIRKKGLKLSHDINNNEFINELASRTQGFTGSDLALLVNEAAIFAAKDGIKKKQRVRTTRKKHFDLAFDKILKGPRSYLDMSSHEREATAIHEAGHAITGMLLEHEGVEKLRHVTILPHTGNLGTTFFASDKEEYHHSFQYYKAQLVMYYGGRAAEELAYGKDHVSSGAVGDIEAASNLARQMVTQFGYSEELGLVNYAGQKMTYLGGSGGENSSMEQKINAEIKQLCDEAYRRAKALLQENWESLIRLSENLVVYEKLDRDQVIDITAIAPGKVKHLSLNKMTAMVDQGNVTPPGLANGASTPNPS